MKETAASIIAFMSNNQLLSTLAAAAILGVAGFVYKWYRDLRHSNKIYEFLRQSLRDTEFRFRTTHAISAATKIPENRVAELCSRHKKIKRNEREKQSWQLVE